MQNIHVRVCEKYTFVYCRWAPAIGALLYQIETMVQALKHTDFNGTAPKAALHAGFTDNTVTFFSGLDAGAGLLASLSILQISLRTISKLCASYFSIFSSRKDIMSALKEAMSADKETMSALKDTMSADKDPMSSDKDIMSADKETMSADKDAITANKAAMSSNKVGMSANKVTMSSLKVAMSAHKVFMSSLKEAISDLKEVTSEVKRGIKTPLLRLPALRCRSPTGRALA